MPWLRSRAARINGMTGITGAGPGSKYKITSIKAVEVRKLAVISGR
jgi:hypothetical protein